jgi:hypothetical protein
VSRQLLDFAVAFSRSTISAGDFAGAYIEKWKQERDAGSVNSDPDDLNECLSTIFCLADLYNPEDDRDEYELNEHELRQKVQETIEQLPQSS